MYITNNQLIKCAQAGHRAKIPGMVLGSLMAIAANEVIFVSSEAQLAEAAMAIKAKPANENLRFEEYTQNCVLAETGRVVLDAPTAKMVQPDIGNIAECIQTKHKEYINRSVASDRADRNVQRWFLGFIFAAAGAFAGRGALASASFTRQARKEIAEKHGKYSKEKHSQFVQKAKAEYNAYGI